MPRLRDEPFPVPPQRSVQPYEIRIEIAQQVGREPRVQEYGPRPHKRLHKARPRRDARQKAIQKAVFAPCPFKKRPRQIHKEPQKKLSVARRDGQEMTPEADAPPYGRRAAAVAYWLCEERQRSTGCRKNKQAFSSVVDMPGTDQAVNDSSRMKLAASGGSGNRCP